MPQTSDWLESKGGEYLKRLETEELVFLGELHLSEEETGQLFHGIRQCRFFYGSDALQAALAVAAVSAAVYASETATSYIEVFFSRLDLPVDNRLWEEYGSEILRFLSKHFNEEDRPGAFRYVRPILNHAGISYRALPAFAKFVDKLFSTCGSSFTKDEYSRCSESVTSRFARRFLVEGPGLEFTRDVIRVLERYRYGLLPATSLDALPGYRPGFWRELLEHTPESRGSEIGHIRRFLDPAEYLDFENGRLVWRFEDRGVARSAYIMNGKVVNFATESVTSRRILGRTFQPDGTSSSWQVEAWAPGGNDAGLFRASDGRFIAAIGGSGEFTTVTPGCFYLVAIGDVVVPTEYVVEEGAWLEYYSGEPHRMWCINLEPGCELATLCLRATAAVVPSLSFASTDTARFSRDHVFARVLPAIRVSDWTESAIHNYILLLDVGLGPTCQDAAVVHGILRLNVPVPCQGTVWIEPRGRSRHPSSALSMLSFTVLPFALRWIVPKEPYGISDEVPIALDADAAVTVDWKSPVQAMAPGRWKLKGGVRVAEATVVVSDIRILFSIPVHRTAIYAPGVRKDIPVIWIEDKPRQVLQLMAVGGGCATLELQDQDGSWSLFDIGNMPSSGRDEVSTNAFRDSLQGATFPAARLGVRVNNKHYWSELFFASAKWIKASLPKATAGWTAFEIPIIGPVLSNVRCLHDERLDRLHIDSRVFETGIGRYVGECALAAAAIEGTAIECPLTQSCTADQNWYPLSSSCNLARLDLKPHSNRKPSTSNRSPWTGSDEWCKHDGVNARAISASPT